MDSTEFVESLKKVLIDNSTRSLIKMLAKPAGRKPAERLVEMSEWYNNLNNTDKDMVNAIIKESIELNTFNFLCVLDGVTAIENEDKGVLRLYYEKGNTPILLNDPEKEYLHNLM